LKESHPFDRRSRSWRREQVKTIARKSMGIRINPPPAYQGRK
jgi:hypothetical protein